MALVTPARAESPCRTISVADSWARLYSPADDALAGYSVASAGDVDGDGRPELLVGGPGRDDYDHSRVGAAWLLSPVAGTASLDAGARFDGDREGDQVGKAVASAGDVDGDGLDDVLVGAPDAEIDGDSGAGVAWLFTLSADGGDTGWSEGGDVRAAARIVGEYPAQYVGLSLAALGDTTGDGRGDFVVGAPGDRSAGAAAGAVYLFDGPVYDEVSVAWADAAYLGEAAGDRGGWSVGSAGDVDGDGDVDLLVGAPYAGGGGRAYLVSGPVSGVRSLADAEARFTGPSGSELGLSVDGAGDLNGDGYDDVVLGGPLDDGAATDAGAAWVFLGPTAGELDAADAVAVLRGATSDSRAGFSVAGVGDVDRDGLDDVLVGAPGARVDGVTGGAAYLVRGAMAGTIDLASADGVYKGGSGASAGWSVSPAGDVDGDGFPDLLIGAIMDGTWGTDGGAAYVVRGGSTGCDTVEDLDRDGWEAGEDCDDADGAVHPGADEDACNGVDDDCDGKVDEGAKPVWYADADGDGWGAGTVTGCDQPSGTSAQGGDCDDGDAAVHPGADEVCDGADDDCDGVTDPPGCDTGDTAPTGDDTDTDTGGVSTLQGCGCEGRGTGGTFALLLLPLLWRRRAR